MRDVGGGGCVVWWVLTDASSLALFSVSYECYNYALGTLEMDISSYCDALPGHSLTETSILSIPPVFVTSTWAEAQLVVVSSVFKYTRVSQAGPVSPSKVLSLSLSHPSSPKFLDLGRNWLQNVCKSARDKSSHNCKSHTNKPQKDHFCSPENSETPCAMGVYSSESGNYKDYAKKFG